MTILHTNSIVVGANSLFGGFGEDLLRRERSEDLLRNVQKAVSRKRFNMWWKYQLCFHEGLGGDIIAV